MRVWSGSFRAFSLQLVVQVAGKARVAPEAGRASARRVLDVFSRGQVVLRPTRAAVADDCVEQAGGRVQAVGVPAAQVAHGQRLQHVQLRTRVRFHGSGLLRYIGPGGGGGGGKASNT